MPLQQTRVLEPREPSVERRRPAAFVQGQRDLPQEANGAPLVALGVRVAECRLQIATRLVPVGGTAVKLGDLLGLGRRQLVAERTPKEAVVAVPAALAVERDEEQVRPLEQLEVRAGSIPVENGVAETAAHLIEDRRAPEKAADVRAQGSEIFGSEVRWDARVPPHALDGDVAAACAPVEPLERQRGEIDAGRPSLAFGDDLRHLLERQLHARRPQQALPLSRRERELLHADLEELPCRPQRRNWKPRRLPPREDDEARVWNVVRERRYGLERLGRAQDVHVLEDDDERIEAAKRSRESRHGGRPEGLGRKRQRVEHVGLQRLDRVERGRDVTQEDGRIVVAVVQ